MDLKYEEAVPVDRLAIMQDFRDNEKKLLKMASHFGIYFCEICFGLSLCETLHFAMYSWYSHFALFLVT